MKKNRNKIHFNGHGRKVDKGNKKIVANVKVLEVAEWLLKVNKNINLYLLLFIVIYLFLYQ